MKNILLARRFIFLFLILFNTGIKIGELLGLTWDDIDFETKTVFLKRQVVQLRKQGNFFTELKTQSSKRHIVIDYFLVDELKRWKLRQSENEKNFGKYYIYIFKTAEGKMVQQSKGLEYLDGTRMDLNTYLYFIKLYKEKFGNYNYWVFFWQRRDTVDK